jgi:hypothetical protein
MSLLEELAHSYNQQGCEHATTNIRRRCDRAKNTRHSSEAGNGLPPAHLVHPCKSERRARAQRGLEVGRGEQQWRASASIAATLTSLPIATTLLAYRLEANEQHVSPCCMQAM